MPIPPKTAAHVSHRVLLLLLQVLLIVVVLAESTTGKVTSATGNVRGRKYRFLFDKTSCDPGPNLVQLDGEEDEVDVGAEIGTNSTANATITRAMFRQQAPDIFHVIWKTTADDETDIVLQIYRDWAPLGADQFYNLILDNYFNCAAFYRYVPGFVVQFGIASEPSETAKWKTALLQDEPVTQSNTIGTITYATSGPNTRTAQVFINLADNSRLDSQGFTPFGKVLSGMDVLKAQVHNPTPGYLGGVSQQLYQQYGAEWVLENYPDIDIIKSTELVEGAYEGPTDAPAVVTVKTAAPTVPDDGGDDEVDSGSSRGNATGGSVLFRFAVVVGSTYWFLFLVLF